MTASFTDLTEYLVLNGWHRDAQGPEGSVWRRDGWDHLLPVLDNLEPANYEWQPTIGQIAAAAHSTPATVNSHIERMYVDVQEFRAADDIYIKGSIALEPGFALFSTARALIRTAASTAQSNKARIGGNYSKAALQIAEKARFGHTIDGSYIVPLLMPLDRPEQPLTDTPFEFEGGGVTNPFIEPEERRTTRTLAQALTAIKNGIVEPAREPKGSIVADLVASGVSREMLTAVEKIVSAEGVGVFEVKFDWAGAFEQPPGELRSVTIPHESAEILRLTADRFEPTTKRPYETLSGQIIDLEDDPQTTGGRATIRTIRRNRIVKIDIPLNEALTEKAHGWFSDHRHVTVSGVVRSFPGRTSWVEGISQFAPIDEVVLFANANDDGPPEV